MSRFAAWPLATALVLCSTIAGHAQSTLDSACAAPEHRQFDFWIGTWAVTDTAGRTLGTNEITRIANGCGLREHWRGARGNQGMSLNVWQPVLGRWTQFWVGTGAVLHLTGGLDASGKMVLTGERRERGVTLWDRITWEAIDSHSVRQRWEISRDSGTSWLQSFEGIYRRRR